MKTNLEKLHMIANKYIDSCNDKWLDMQDKFYVCMTYSEIISDVVYGLFEKDVFEEVATGYKVCNRYGNGGIEVLCELEEGIYFSFIIYNVTGMFGDNGERITDGKFKILKAFPEGYTDIWDLFDSENEESEE